jgi:hypothetical protein
MKKYFLILSISLYLLRSNVPIQTVPCSCVLFDGKCCPVLLVTEPLVCPSVIQMATGMVRQGKGAAMTARGVEICVKGNFGMKMPRQADAAAVVVVVVDVAAVGTSGRSRSVR